MQACKEHKGCLNNYGYGVIRHNGRTELAHRVAYCAANDLSIDEIKGKVVRHTCDNRRCIEPTHLLIGSQADNVKDMLERRRQRYTPLLRFTGQSNPNAKLTYAAVMSIRSKYEAGETQKQLAKRYGVSSSLIGYVVNRKIWHGDLFEINARLAPIQITAAGLESLGFAPAAIDKSARMYRASDFPRICNALIDTLRIAAGEALA